MTQFADVIVPPGEGTRATVLRWCKQIGDPVRKDEPLLELETDKVTVEIPSPADGTLVEVLKLANAEVNPDEVLARLSLGGERQPPADAPRAAAASSLDRVSAAATPEARARLSPSVRRLLQQHAIAPAD